MSYSPPQFGDSVQLVCGYSAPLLVQTVVLGAEAISVSATVDASLPAAPVLELHFQALGYSASNSGGTYDPPAVLVPILLTCGYSAPGLAVQVTLCQSAVVISAALAAAFPPVALPLSVGALASVALDLPDVDGCRTGLRWRERIGVAAGLLSDSAEMNAVDRRAMAPHAASVPLSASLHTSETQTQSVGNWSQLTQGGGIRLPGLATARHADAPRMRQRLRATAQAADQIDGRAGLTQRDRLRTRDRASASATDAAPTTNHLATPSRGAVRTAARLGPEQTEATWPLPGRWWPRYEAPGLTLRLCCLEVPAPGAPVVLTWAYPAWPRCPGVVPPDPGGTVIVPVRKVYFVMNTLSLKRVSDGVEVPCESLSLDLSASDWAWSFSATVPGYAEALVRGDAPVELTAMVNGEPIRLVVRSVQRSREFGKSTLSVSGIGRAAVLADPQARSVSRFNAQARTAAQLLDDALTENGVPIGWTVDWRIEDWAVPAGYWSHTGTYIEAATRIAEAGGGYVQAHDVQPILRVLPWYPRAPWDWSSATPDIQLPEDVCKVEGVEWMSKTPVNAVWITGGTRRDHIKRAGSAGDVQAQTIVDQLATDVIMTRQRGLRALAEGGDQALITLSLPVLDEVGIIRPGQLIRYQEQGRTHVGMSRAVSVSCGFPDVWQSIKVEVRA